MHCVVTCDPLDHRPGPMDQCNELQAIITKSYFHPARLRACKCPSKSDEIRTYIHASSLLGRMCSTILLGIALAPLATLTS
ncbi:hypothetical protein SCLCIDRAFT_1223743 [Scleroderma citrinum Foug A]|uniref:Uncharacterized protein n=1 Tax=Scleroderma citrinum Foug A TaxID=1036808 RepID=A0A0C3CV73_9AGAM|nr:hypothetical protein SCLCIDRAFT_1223743 [Scleroderma citrinum Foug A]